MSFAAKINHAFRVGKYTVLLTEFESVALSSLKQAADFVIIDEIGKEASSLQKGH